MREWKKDGGEGHHATQHKRSEQEVRLGRSTFVNEQEEARRTKDIEGD
jgi:hypothetical protein